MGTVIERIDKQVSDSYGGTVHTYYLVISFGEDGEDIRLKADVAKRIFDSKSEGESMDIRHIPRHPRVALLEGEY